MSYHIKWSISFSVIFIFLGLFLLPEDKEYNAYAAEQKKSTQLIEPCDLISRVEAEKIMGTALKEGQCSEKKVVGQKICIYEAADENSFVFLQISLTQNAFIDPKVLASGQNAKAIFTSIKNAFPDREDIREIGDDAFIAVPGIHILKGNYYLTIGAGNINRQKNKLISAGAKAIDSLEASF